MDNILTEIAVIWLIGIPFSFVVFSVIHELANKYDAEYMDVISQLDIALGGRSYIVISLMYCLATMIWPMVIVGLLTDALYRLMFK